MRLGPVNTWVEVADASSLTTPLMLRRQGASSWRKHMLTRIGS